MLTQLASASIVTLARTLTGVRAIWLVGAPQATPTVYFANHRSHGDFVLLWTSLPPDLRSLTRPVAAADYWLASPTRRFIGCEVFRAVLIDRTGAGDRSDPITQMADALDRALGRKGWAEEGDRKRAMLASGTLAAESYVTRRDRRIVARATVSLIPPPVGVVFPGNTDRMVTLSVYSLVNSAMR